MSSYTFRSSRPNQWVSPRAYSDPSLRRMHYGAIQPMQSQRTSLFARLLRAG